MKVTIRFKPATDYTKDVFNPWGVGRYDAVLETQVRPVGFASVDLTILKTLSGFYVFAHGSVITENRFSTDKQACVAARDWYKANYSRFKLASI